MMPRRTRRSSLPGGAESGKLRFENFLFLGDSLISNPHYVSNLFRLRGHQVFAGGGAVIPNFFGSTAHEVTVGSIGAMTGTLKGREFNGIVILLGANDLGSKDADTVMRDYKALIAELQGAYSQPVFILKVFPINGAYQERYGASVQARMDRTEEFNRQMSAYCADTPGVWFIDATDGFTDANGFLIKDVGDGLHISPTYYGEFYEAIERALYATGLFDLS